MSSEQQQSIRDLATKIVSCTKDLLTELSRLQELCEHPNATKQYGGNTGNYDPHADSYWIDFECPDCRKIWRTPQ